MRRYILAALCTITLGWPAMAQNVGESIDVAGWTVRRVQGDNKTQSCVAATVADDKSGVGFGVSTTMQAFMLLIDGTGKLKPGTEQALEWKVDNGKTAKGTGRVVSPQTVVVSLGTVQDVAPFYTAIEEGDNIHLENADDAFDYSLTGSKAALAALTKCLEAAME